MKKNKIEKIDVIELTQHQPSEFNPKLKYYEIFGDNGLMNGRMVCGSKSTYKNKYPDHMVIFNANIVIRSKGKIWCGDLDIDIDGDKLYKISKELGEHLYVLHEMDCRFGNEEDDINELIKRAMWSTDPDFKPNPPSGVWTFGKDGKSKRV